MTDATREGASEPSVHDRLTAYLSAEEPQEEEVVEGEPTETEHEEHEAPETDEGAETREDDAPEETEEQQIELAAVAKLLGVEEDDLVVEDDGTVALKTKIDGTEGKAKLSDLRKSHQLEGHLNKKNMEVAERDKQLQEHRKALETEYGQRLQYADSLNAMAYKEMQGQFAAVDWNKLKAEDPVGYTIARQEFSEREQAIRQRAQAIETEKTGLQQKQQQEYGKYLETETKALAAEMKWSDPQAAVKGYTEIEDYLVGQGVPQAEVRALGNHKAFVIAHKAMLYDKLQAGKPALQKKIAAAPKLSRPGSAVTTSKSAALDKLKSNIKSGRKGSVAEYLMKSGKV